MNLDDGMIPPKKRAPWWAYAAAGALLVIIAALTLTPRTPPASDRQPAPPPSAAPAEPVQHDTPPAAPAGAWHTAAVFLVGWTSTDSAARADKLRASALPDLAGGLALTDPGNVITDPIESIETVSAEPYSAEFRVAFPGRDPVWLLLTNGHGDPDWRVARVEQHPD